MTVENTLAERGSRYGEFADHARIAQGIQDVMRAAPKWNQLDLDQKQALSVIADKIARILNGDPYYTDNWHDIQGYAQLIENRLKMLETPAEDAELFEPASYKPENPSWMLNGQIPISHGRATGGPVRPGIPYIVGEQPREFLTHHPK